MRFVATPIEGAFIIELELIEDERGFFSRTYCRDEFEMHGLEPDLVQCSISQNKQRGTVRGMHYQNEPHAEAKLVRCTQGAIYDAIVDIRQKSATYKRWFGVELTAENHRALYIPKGVAHGFQTLSDNTEVLYQMSEFFHPECSFGFCWNDASFQVAWPEPVRVISKRDMSYPTFIEKV
jgi:dTDP-4-dehydrorhamnose 3,5-epimerase